MAIRSGRFRSDGSSDITIIDGRSGAFYRVLNSGENNFRVDAGGSATTIAPRFSIDVVVSGNVDIEPLDSEPLEGMYDYLDTDRDVRSGRFKTAEATLAEPHKIIDLTVSSGPKPRVFYRVFNSGRFPFVLIYGSKTQDIGLDQSFDFEIKATGQRDVYVRSVVDGQLIEGIYDFLGKE